ncbi:hypothetical protein TK0097 [Thermococcus kodakarensis KOD1]|uniref:Uncharacterized protein n=1 Tax=Thermococcus kodakarensis (strain ATCC BAA-918 / JCM 12380 / KOD1) TaxID=69014 RepID=Q5JEI9_THEKO|nr:hypothetical protein [Thermococcus kodakarensis]WCN28211.1 hypothetical protein POG15_00515 [Thermococcus kodakarensis]WCN30508.1 hypothetical protein POG21_00515 [Thermococcus kodakarensis]BAD84286.1 hypothetical protein TK0097 [Thermococcus kodakarensis KOD1]
MVRVLVYPGDTLAAMVAEARWRKEQVEEVPTLLEYIERELQVARDTAFSLSARGEKENAAYWTGYADALEDLLKKIERREVRA